MVLRRCDDGVCFGVGCAGDLCRARLSIGSKIPPAGRQQAVSRQGVRLVCAGRRCGVRKLAHGVG